MKISVPAVGHLPVVLASKATEALETRQIMATALGYQTERDDKTLPLAKGASPRGCRIYIKQAGTEWEASPCWLVFRVPEVATYRQLEEKTN